MTSYTLTNTPNTKNFQLTRLLDGTTYTCSPSQSTEYKFNASMIIGILSYSINDTSFSLGPTPVNGDIIHNATDATIPAIINPPTTTSLTKYFTKKYQLGDATNFTSSDVTVDAGNYSQLVLTDSSSVVTFYWGSAVTSCVHPDMIVDEVGVKISKLETYPDHRYKKLLQFAATDDFVRIKKDALAENIPSADLLLTPGHPIVFNNIEIKAKDLVNDKTIVYEKLDTPVNVYALVFTGVRRCVKIHNVDVVQWDNDEWEEYSKKCSE